MGEPDPHPGPLSQAVAFATIGRAAVERHAETEAILAYEHALPLAEAAVAAGDGPHEDLVRFLGYVHDVLGGLKRSRTRLSSRRSERATRSRRRSATETWRAWKRPWGGSASTWGSCPPSMNSGG
jgi:hypothetical protein